MKRKRNFLLVYLSLALLLGFVGIVSDLIGLLGKVSNIHFYIMGNLVLLFFLFNVVAIPVFHHLKLERIVYVLPIYYLVSYVLFFILGLVLTITEAMIGIFTIISILTSVFEIGFSIYLIKKLEVF